SWTFGVARATPNVQDRCLPDREDVDAGLLTVRRRAGQAAGRGVEERAGLARPGHLQGRPRLAGAVRVAHAGRNAAEPVRALAGVARLPLELPVVEHDVEGAVGHVAAVDDEQLE